MSYNNNQTNLSAEECELLADLVYPHDKTEEEQLAELIADLAKIVTPKDAADIVKLGANFVGPAGPGVSVVDDEDALVDSDHSDSPSVPGTSLSSAVKQTVPLTIDATDPDQTVLTDVPARSCPDGYEIFDDGIYENSAGENGEPLFICTPLRVDATFADEQGRGWGKLVSVKSADGQWHQISIKNSDLFRRSTEVISSMVDFGLVLGTARKSKERLLTFLTHWKPETRLKSVTQMGWVNESFDTFVLGSTIIGSAAVLPPSHAPSVGIGLISHGTIADWKKHVGAKCRDNPLMVLAVSLAFSGPLLAAMGLSGGGLHFRGASSSGKTTLLNLAASVWGSRQLITQWRATSNGLEAVAATLNDMILPLDEIAEISARDLSYAIYMLANGTGKTRMTKDVILAHQARWRLALISSGEISVQEKLAEGRLDTKTGHEVRLIDIEADSRAFGAFDNLHGAINAASFAEDIQRRTRDVHGAVGHEFIQMMITKKTVIRVDQLNNIVRGYAADWLKKLPGAADGATSRVAMRFAVIGAAGELATKFGLTGWEDREAENAAEQAFLDWYDRRYGVRREAVESFVKPLQEFLSANLNGLPKVDGPHVAGDEPAGWIDASRAYLAQITWGAIFAGVDGTNAAKALLNMDMLIPGEEGRSMRKAPRKIPGRPRLYTLNIDRVMAFKPT